MKWTTVFAAIGLAAVQTAAAQTTLFYQNDGVIQCPPAIPPNIDAVNFINNNIFEVNLEATGGRPFFTANTLNYTNFGQIRGNVGFLFQHFDPTNAPQNQVGWAETFANIGSIETLGFNIPTSPFVIDAVGSKVVINAGLIYSPGVIHSGINSFLNLNGGLVDISRGTIRMDGFLDENTAGNTVGMFDNYWGLQWNTNNAGAFFNANNTPFHTVTNRYAEEELVVLNLTNAVVYSRDEGNALGGNRFIRVAYVQNTNASMETRVYFPNRGFGPTANEIAVEWVWTNAPLFSSTGTVDNLYLVDTMNFPIGQENLMANGASAARTTFRPSNYDFVRGRPFVGVPETPIPFIFDGGVTTNFSTAYQMRMEATTVVPADVAGQNATNMPGRIILRAAERLAMTNAFILGPNVLEIYSPKDFSGVEGAQIAVPLASFDLTNLSGSITISNLLHPALPRPEGTVSLYSCQWTNIVGTVTNHFHVIYVDSQFTPNSGGRVQDLKLTATNLVVNDQINVTRSLLYAGETLTIASNAPTARIPTGGIELQSDRIIWSDAMPRLSYLTNEGTIRTRNAVYFGGRRTSPYYNVNFNEPYRTFRNAGSVFTEGTLVWARAFENTGLFRSSSGSFTLSSTTGRLLGGEVSTPIGDITLSGASLVVSNTALNAGRRLALIASSQLSDETVTNGNFWTVGGGGSSVPGISLSLPTRTTAANLLGTVISNVCPQRGEFRVIWDGADKGATAAGFANNAAVGKLILNAQGEYSTFAFTAQTGQRAIYVDLLELHGFASRYDGNGAVSAYPALNVAPNMKVYFAKAIDATTGIDMSGRLDGLFGGRMAWVRDYSGYFSSTNLLTPPYAQPSNPPSDDDDGGTGGGGEPDITPDAIKTSLAFPGTIHPTAPATRQFISVRGSYVGLFHQTTGVDMTSAGSVKMLTTTLGGYTGTLKIGAKVYPFSGKFDPTGRAIKTVKRLGLPTLTLDLQLDLAGGDQIRGTITDGVWTANLLANRNVYHQYRKCLEQGTRTLLLPPDASSPNSPAGYGFASVKISSIGGVIYTLTLPDGQKLTQQTSISKEGIWPLHAAPYQGKGLVIGWLKVDDSDDDSAEGDNTDDDSEVLWFKPAGLPGAYYPAGFTNECHPTLSAYTKPAAAKPKNFTSATLTLSGDFAGSPVQVPVNVSPSGRFTSTQPGFSLGMATGTGWFWGSAKNPETGKTLPFQGMWSQGQNLGAGFTWTSNRIGSVVLSPAP